MPLNLDPIKKIVEGYMVDRCTVVRDPEGAADDLWNDATGLYEPPVGDFIQIYAGVCMIYPNSAFTERQRGDVPENVTQYWLEVPVTAKGFQPEDIVTCTLAVNDSALVNKIFLLDTEETDTYAASRRLRMHDRKPVPT